MGDAELHNRAGKYVEADKYDPENQREIYYLLASSNDTPVGVLVYHVIDNPIMYQGHLNYLPKFWGTGLEKHTIEACRWMFNNTDCQKIIGFAPDHYPEVLKHAIKCGFRKEGYLSNSVLSDGNPDNQTIMGLSKWEQQQQ